MSKRKMFGKDCQFATYLSEKDTLAYISGGKNLLSDTLIASLSIGVLKIEAVLYKTGSAAIPRYEVFVKTGEGSSEWICYDSPDVEVSCREGRLENEMFEMLETVRKKNRLSYGRVNFGELNGKSCRKKRT